MQWAYRHPGSDVFVIGSSPQLLALSRDQLSELQHRVCVGGNLTFYRVPLSYFLSSYRVHVLLASLYLQPEQIIKLNGWWEHKQDQDPRCLLVNNLDRERYTEAHELPIPFKQYQPRLVTMQNQALALTHFSAVLGARRIIFVGVDQSSSNYFYDDAPEYVTRIRRDLHKVQTGFRKNYLQNKVGGGELKIIYERLSLAGSRVQVCPYYRDFRQLFQCFFYDLMNRGIEVISTLRGSVVHKAGARYLALDQALSLTV